MSSIRNEKSSSRTASLADFVEGRPRALMVPEVAALLNVSGRQIYKLAAEQRIPCLRIAGCIRFDPWALAIWLRQKAASPDTAAKSDESWKNDGSGWSFGPEAQE
jgi:excisionase family DNA binding protein